MDTTRRTSSTTYLIVAVFFVILSFLLFPTTPLSVVAPTIGVLAPAPIVLTTTTTTTTTTTVQPIFRWTVTAPVDEGQSQAIVMDSNDNVIVVGEFNTSITFGTGVNQVTLYSEGEHDGFLAKFDSQSNLLWVKQFGSTGYDVAWAVTVDRYDSLLVLCEFGAYVNMEGRDILSPSYPTFALLKYNPGGELDWLTSAVTNELSLPKAVTVDSSDNIYVAGSFSGALSFGDTVVESTGLMDLFVYRLNSSGHVTGSQKAGGLNSGVYCSGIVLDNAENIIVAGDYFGQISDVVTSGSPSNIFVMRLAPNLDIINISSACGEATCFANSVVIDNLGRVLVVGFFTGNITALDGQLILSSVDSVTVDMLGLIFNPVTGNFGAIGIGGNGTDIALGVAIDAQDNFYLVGTFTEEITIQCVAGTIVIPASDSTNVIVAKYNKFGEYVWSKHIWGPEDIFGVALYASKVSNSIALTGYYSGNASFCNGELSDGSPYSVFVSLLEEEVIESSNQTESSPSPTLAPIESSLVLPYSVTISELSSTIADDQTLPVHSYQDQSDSINNSDLSFISIPGESSAIVDTSIVDISSVDFPSVSYSNSESTPSAASSFMFTFSEFQEESSAIVDTSAEVSDSDVTVSELVPVPYSCFGKSVNDSNVCSDNGLCIDSDTCVCDPGMYGDECQLVCDTHTFQISVLGGLDHFVPANSAVQLLAIPFIPSCVETMNYTIDYSWSLYNSSVQISNNSIFKVKPESEGTYSYTLTATLITPVITFMDRITFNLHVEAAKPVAMIANGSRSARMLKLLVLDGSISRSTLPDSLLKKTQTNFTWSCTSENIVDVNCGLDLPPQPVVYAMLNMKALCMFSLSYSANGVTSSTSIEVDFVDTDIPVAAIVTILPLVINTRKRLRLEAVIDNPDNIPVTLVWEITRQEDGNILPESMYASKSGYRFLALKENALQTNSTYTFRLFVNSIKGTSFAAVVGKTSSPPLQGTVAVNPTNGTLLDKFYLSAEKWSAQSDSTMLLLYTFEFQDASGIWQVLGAPSYNNFLETNLPKSDSLIVRVRVSDALLSAELTANTTVTVKQPDDKGIFNAEKFVSEKLEELKQKQDLEAGEIEKSIIIWSSLLDNSEVGKYSTLIPYEALKDELMLLLNQSIANNTVKTYPDYVYRMQVSAMELLSRHGLSNNSTDLLLKLLTDVNSYWMETAADTSDVAHDILVRYLKAASNVLVILDPDLTNSIVKLFLLIATDKQLLQVPGEEAATLSTSNAVVNITVQSDYVAGLSHYVISQNQIGLQFPDLEQVSRIAEDDIVGYHYLSYSINPYVWANGTIHTPVIVLRFTNVTGQKIVTQNLTEPLVIELPHVLTDVSNLKTTPECQYWNEDDPNQSDWKGDGCKFVSINTTHITCHCFHTTSFAAFRGYSKEQLIQAYIHPNFHYASIATNGSLFFIALALFIPLILLRNYQPLRSRFIAPIVGMFVVLIDSMLEGVVRSIVVLSLSNAAKVNIMGCVIVVVVCTLSILAWLLFLWQELRFICLQQLYRSMSSPGLTNPKIITKFIVSKRVYVTVVIGATIALFSYFALWSILFGAGAISVRTQTLIQVLSYSFLSMIIGVTLLVTITWDTIRSLYSCWCKTVAPAEKAIPEVKVVPVMQRLKICVREFLRTDLLWFRVESLLMCLTVLVSFASYIPGIVGIIRYSSDYDPDMIVSTSFNYFYLLLRIVTFGGFISAVTISQAWNYKQSSAQQDKLEEDSVVLSNVMADKILSWMFHQFCENEFSVENILCHDEILRVKNELALLTPSQRESELVKFKALYLDENAVREVNISGTIRTQCCRTFETAHDESRDRLNHIMEQLECAILRNLQDSFARFRHTKEYRTYANNNTVGRELEDRLRIDHKIKQIPASPDSKTKTL
jgi:hypothetical protein